MNEKLNKKTNVGALSVRNTKNNLPNCAQKGNKGITLVALIITIIVLLILAVVAIRAVSNDGIIGHAKNAQTGYEQAQTNEQTTLESLLGTIESNIVEKISTQTSYVGYYADVDGDKEPDGIIYIDKAKTVSGSWGSYSYTITNVTTGLKEYYISKESHTTKLETAPVLSLVPGSTGKERFYVMALEDVKTDNYTTFYWYKNGNITDPLTQTASGVGAGKTNTSNMKSKYGTYGEIDGGDMWNVVKEGWYIPSYDEWTAFASAFSVTSSNKSDLGLSNWYWSSLLSNSEVAWSVHFNQENWITADFGCDLCVRLGTTF